MRPNRMYQQFIVTIILMIPFCVQAQDIANSGFTPGESGIILVSDSSGVSSVSSSTDIIIGTSEINGDEDKYRTIIGFDISSVPENANMVSIELDFSTNAQTSDYYFAVNVVSIFSVNDLDTQFQRIEDGLKLGSVSYEQENSFFAYPNNPSVPENILNKVFSGDTTLNASGDLVLGFLSHDEEETDSEFSTNVSAKITFLVPVKGKNVNENGNNISSASTLTINGTSINSGDSTFVSAGQIIPVATDHEILNDQGSETKHNRWNQIPSKYYLSHSDTLKNINKLEQRAFFKPIHPATVQTRLFDTNSSDVVPVEVHDPWYVNSKSNQTEPWLSYPSGFTGATMPNGGIFLDQEPNTNNSSIPHYSIRTTPQLYRCQRH